MAWKPQEEGLEQILKLLKASQSPITEVQREVQHVSFLYVNIGILKLHLFNIFLKAFSNVFLSI